MLRIQSRSLARSTLSLALGAAVTFSSCSKVNEMHDATMGMAKTTSGMAKTTEGMSKTTDHMSETTDSMEKTTGRMEDTTCKMYTSLRQGNSKLSRDTDMKAIREGKSLTEKLELAAKYMQGFEYQVWTTACSDIAPREIVIDQAATELLTASQPFADDRSNVSATQQSKSVETLYAVVATLHRTNSLQAGFLKGSGEKLMTPFDILVEGIRYDQQKNRGELKDAKFPIWAVTVGKYEKDAEYLIRLRGNFMMAYAYAVADSDSFGNSPGLAKKIATVMGAKLFGKKWTPNLSKRTGTEIRERITTPLNYSFEARAALTKLGIDPMIDPVMIKLWKSADFSSYDLAKMEKNGGDDLGRATAIRELIAARNRVLSGIKR